MKYSTNHKEKGSEVRMILIGNGAGVAGIFVTVPADQGQPCYDNSVTPYCQYHEQCVLSVENIVVYPRVHYQQEPVRLGFIGFEYCSGEGIALTIIARMHFLYRYKNYAVIRLTFSEIVRLMRVNLILLFRNNTSVRQNLQE